MVEPLISWTANLETGHPEIDAQHKTLIESLNRLKAAIDEGRGEEELGWCLSFLKAYTRVHFRTEEALFATHPSPDTQRHIAIHQELVKEVDVLFRRFLKGETKLLLPTLDMLHGWLMEHIQVEDRDLLRAIPNSAGGDFSAGQELASGAGPRG